jgi:hypothetical protein
MKILALACGVVFWVAASANAAQPVPADSLRDMGLASIEPLADDAGLAVRGRGTFAGVWGGSTASWGGQSSSNNYAASSSWFGKPATSLGGSFSFGGRTSLWLR